MKIKIRNSMCGLLLIPLLLACFALLPRVQAAPDPAAIPGGNTRDGAGSLASRTTGQFNSAFGTNALNKLTSGNNNAAQGNSALFSNVNGSSNVAIGNLALRLNTDGFQNTAVGGNALNSNVHGPRNAALGYSALRSNTGTDNTAVGWQALVSNLGGEVNTAVGVNAIASNETGNANTALGWQALFQATGGDNIALGAGAGSDVTTGSNNIDIGNAGAAETDTIRIGLPTGTGHQTATFIAGILGQSVPSGIAVLIGTNHRLGTAVSSSARFKNEIKPMDKASEAILALNPVTFRYKKDLDPARTPQFGLIAEEVEKVNPDLVGRDANGEITSVRYDAVNAMLLNEFLKEHRTVEELKSTAEKQEATIARQQKQIEALTTGLQKVSDQLETSRPAPQMVANDQ
jgi:hypothetical protein